MNNPTELSNIPSAAPSATTISKENRAHEYLVRSSFIDGRPMLLVERCDTVDVAGVFENSELGNYLADMACERFNQGRVRV